MTDFAIDPITGDLIFENGDFVEVSELDEIGQRLAFKLSLVQGEWFYNRLLGFPYYSQVFGRTRPDPISLNAVYVEAILSTDGVLELIEPIDYEFNKVNRVMTISFKVRTESGVLELTV